jgi:hypothetical protein
MFCLFIGICLLALLRSSKEALSLLDLPLANPGQRLAQRELWYQCPG